MQSMRDLLKQNLGRSLDGLPEIDRLEAAWPVACGPALAARARLFAYDSGLVQIEVASPAWFDQFLAMRPVLERELARIAGVRVTAIHYTQRPHRT
jgi:hypothetical protein